MIQRLQLRPIILQGFGCLTFLVFVLGAPPQDGQAASSFMGQRVPSQKQPEPSNLPKQGRPAAKRKKGSRKRDPKKKEQEAETTVGEEEEPPHVPYPVPNQENSTLELLGMFRPCVKCGSYARFGAAQDGGYVMCDDPELLEGVRAAFSFGIEGRDEWGLSVSRRLGGIRVFEFDCHDDRPPVCNDNDSFKQKECPLRFHKECLGMPWYGRKKGDLYRTLGQHLERNPPPRYRNQTQKRQVGGDLLLKVDLEGQEWPTFARARPRDLQRMRQIVVEFHMLSKVKIHAFAVVALRRILDAGFVVAHIHGNNFSPMNVFGGRYQIPDAIEVTFVNKRALTERQHQECSTVQDLLPQDAPNHGYFELPLARLPGAHDTLNGYTSIANASLVKPKGGRVSKLVVAHQCRWLCHTGPAAWPLAAVSGISVLIAVGLLRAASYTGTSDKMN